MLNKLLVLAPHVDDEAIGCFRALSSSRYESKTVIYFFELSDIRVTEAKVFAKTLGFTPVFFKEGLDIKSFVTPQTEVFVPCCYDQHPDHKFINQTYRKYATSFYSADMTQGRDLLNPEVAKLKKECLSIFKSQKALLDSSEHYWLFEANFSRDYQATVTYAFSLEHKVYGLYKLKITHLKNNPRVTEEDLSFSNDVENFEQALFEKALEKVRHGDLTIVFSPDSGIEEIAYSTKGR